MPSKQTYPNKSQAMVIRAACMGAIKNRMMRKKDLDAMLKARPQHTYDVLAGFKPMSRRFAMGARRALKKFVLKEAA